MLHEFLESKRSDIIARTKVKAAARPTPRVTEAELTCGVPLFVDQLIDALKGVALLDGNDLRRTGLTIGQVIHDYGHLSQAVTELAFELDAKVTIDEFRMLNRCLDNAIAAAVTEYGRTRKQPMNGRGTVHVDAVPIIGSTGARYERTLKGMNDLIDRSLAEVRVESAARRPETILLAEFVEEMESSASKEATVHGHELMVARVEEGVEIEADRTMLATAVANLLKNAFQFTRAPGRVWLRTRIAADRVFIDIQDECGGFPPGQAAALFHPFQEQSSRLGRGLSISRKAVQSNGGDIQVRNLRGKACIFTIALPRKLGLEPNISSAAS